MMCPYLSPFSLNEPRACEAAFNSRNVYYIYIYIDIYMNIYTPIWRDCAIVLLVTKNVVPSGWIRTLRPLRAEEDAAGGASYLI